MAAMLSGIVVLAVLLLGVESQDHISSVLSHCCRQGDPYGPSHGPEDCRNLPPPQVVVSPQDQSLCQEVMHICCLKRHRADMCQRGKAAAKAGRTTCTGLGNNKDMTDCCEGCLLGSSLAARGADCNSLVTEFGDPWGPAAQECCLLHRRDNPSIPSNPYEPSQNRCEINPRLCSQKCTDPGSRAGPVRCSCDSGYRLASDRRQCVDIDECAEARDTCDPQRETCLNSPGGFHCVENEYPPPPVGGGSGRPALPPHPAHGNRCPLGYHFNITLKVCDDTDECTGGRNPCDPLTQQCTNTLGSFVCQPLTTTNELDIQQPECPYGFQHQVGHGCVDVDECSESLDNCDLSTEYCLNVYGSFQCQLKTSKTCPAGYKFLVGTCTDVDECSENLHACQEGEENCRNTAGGYVCDQACPSGSTLNEDTGQCQEETTRPSSAGHIFPSTGRDCPAGYKHKSPQDSLCVDVDECAEGIHACDLSVEICANSEGSYDCVPVVQQPEGPSRTTKPPYPPSRDHHHPAREVDHNQPRGVDPTSRDHLPSRGVDPPSRGMDHHHPSRGVDPPSRGVDHNPSRGVDTNPNCPLGSRFDSQARICRDVDECSENLHDCDLSRERCVNTQGSYRCQPDTSRLPRCPNGFIFDHVTGGCRDVDECQSTASPCTGGTICVNLRGTYRCDPLGISPVRNDSNVDFCRRGYEWNPNSRSCVDTDECRDASSACPNSVCENTVGSFRCGCSSGLTLDPVTKVCVDLNECQLGMHNCLPTQRCDNTMGSFVCVRITSCGTGYTVNVETGVCEDDDECRIRSSACGPDFVCRNTLGSFRCDRVSCAHGEKLLPDGTCQAKECAPGTRSTPLGNCADIDECAVGTARCRSNQRCINSYGSYTCQNLLACGGGYEADQQGSQCLDVDECVDGSHECGPGQVCRNRPGGYSCECPTGFTLNAKRECEDIDECSRFAGQVCSISSQCQNSIGSYLCDCKAGFTKVTGAQTCTDVDECRDTPNLCQHNCINTWGGYQCTCKAGFTLGHDNRSCVDIDECTFYKGKGSLCIGFCVNEPGSFSCSCPDGYRLGGDLRTCNDINECQELGVCSAEDQVCLNTRGGYKCTNISCPPNYVRDKEHKNRATGVCRKRCSPGDLECANNSTQSISFQGVALPSVPELRQPLVLSTMRLTSSTSPTGRPLGQSFVILEGNNQNYYDMRVGDGVGTVRLVRPIIGPQEHLLKVQMEAQLRRKLSRHLVYIHINVSPYNF